jgi:hypothetical protein
MTTLALLNLPYPLLDAVAGATVTSGIVAVPTRATTATWQTVFAVAPSAINVTIEASLDGVNFNTISTSTVTTGEVNTVNFNATHVRSKINSVSGGSGISVLIDFKDL